MLTPKPANSLIEGCDSGKARRRFRLRQIKNQSAAARMKGNRMRATRQRAEILEVLKNTKCHPTAEWIYNEVKKEIPDVSVSTVYRNLDILEKSGEIIKIRGVYGKDRYDGDTTEHAHLVCTNCHGVSDVPIPFELGEAVKEFCPSTVEGFALTYYGLCADCARKLINNKNNS